MTSGMPPETPSPRRIARRAALFGAALAVLCHFLPPEHREVCRVVANACTGGLLP